MFGQCWGKATVNTLNIVLHILIDLSPEASTFTYPLSLEKTVTNSDQILRIV